MNILNHRRKWKQGNSSGQTVSLSCPAASPASHYNLGSAGMCSSCHARSQPAESSPVHEVVPHTTPINALHLSPDVWKRVKISLTNMRDAIHAGTVCAPEPSCECEPGPGWSQNTGPYEITGPGLPYCCSEGSAGFMPCFAQGVAFALFYSLESREVY